jgi:phage terminase large subunit-like protein
MTEEVNSLLQHLQTHNPTEALAILNAYEDKRKEENYVKYWSAYPRQGELFREFTKEVKTFGILGGNRSGKTELGAFIATAWALGRDFFLNEPAWEYVRDLPIPAVPNNIWVVGLDFPTLRDVIWREKLRFGRNHPPLIPNDGTVVKKTNDNDFQIFFTNGSIITGKSADSGREKFQGASVDLVWIDEEPEADIYDECYQRTLDCGGKILLTLTPLSDMNSGVRTPWVFDLYEEAKSGRKDIKFVQLSLLDNPYVPQEEKDRAMVKWSGHHEERARLYGEFISRSGLVYSTWNRDTHTIQPQQIPPTWRRIVSIDPAATGITAAIWVAISPKGNLYLYREYYERDLTVSEHAKNIRVRNGTDPIDLWLIDPKWGSQRNAENHKNGAQLYKENQIPVRLASVAEDFGLNESREYIQAVTVEGSRHPKVFVFNDLKHFIFEIEHYTWGAFGQGENKGLSKEKPRKRNDHLMNAFQYVCAMRPKGDGGKSEILSPEERKANALRNSYT